MMKCPNCSKEVPDSAKVCGFCGTKLKTVQTCSSCAKEVPLTAKVCGYCGTRLVDAAPVIPPAEVEAEPAPVEPEAIVEANSVPVQEKVAEKEPVEKKPEMPKKTTKKKANKPVSKQEKKTAKAAKQKKPVSSGKKLPKWGLPVIIGSVCLVIAFLVLYKTLFLSPLDFLAGSWSGAAYNDGHQFDYKMWFDSGCKLGEVCGSFDLPDINCSGKVSIISISGDKYFFKTSGLSTGCGGTTYEEYIDPFNSTTLRIRSEGDYGVTLATLFKE